MFKYDLGYKAKDKITGFTGIISFRVQFITGCNQYGLQPEMDKKTNTVPEALQYDENRLQLLSRKPVVYIENGNIPAPKPSKAAKKDGPGGPAPRIQNRRAISQKR